MDVTSIISPLNDAQRLAVTAPSQSMLVLAGAGSGKTRVLVHRIAWQIQVQGCSPQSILAVTFTNKAAREMRNRIEQLLNISTRTLWIGTFHGIALQLLRRHSTQAKLPETFQVMDASDQLRLIKRLLESLELDPEKWPPRQIQWHINAQKEEGIRARHCLDASDRHSQQLLTIYRAYEQLCERSGLVDFAELLLRAHELLRDHADLLEFYRQRFKHIHVDEFQDTNTVQYAWLRLLTQDQDNLFVVGDDDQSIYGWRGAKMEHIHDFQRHYPNHQLVKLEQNYRSTGNILKAANSIISLNDGRIGKELWTEASEGERISLYAAFNEQDEAHFVVNRIRSWINTGEARCNIAILYRSNAQSRQFEERLMTEGIPYRVYGGLRFFDRAEIKNALAYLRLLSNHDDDAALERIINIPTRGIGNKTVDAIRLLAKEKQLSLWGATQQLIAHSLLSARTLQVLRAFIELIQQLSLEIEPLSLYQKVEWVVDKTGLLSFHQNEKADNREEKIENLRELVNAARYFDAAEYSDTQLDELHLFLAHSALESGEMQGETYEDCVQLMTLHSAKGLEFKSVFLVGMEEGLFPSQQALDDAKRLEEERRLCYVGITRAMQQLYLTYAESRRIYGRESNARPSRFLREIPNEQLQEIRLRGDFSHPAATKRTETSNDLFDCPFRLGQQVHHPKFGEGMVLQIEGSKAQQRIQINFRDVGIKWLMLSYASLEPR